MKKNDDYDILNMSDEEIIKLEKEMLECELAMDSQKHKHKIIVGVIIGIVVIGVVCWLLISLLKPQNAGKYVGTRTGQSILGGSYTWETVIKLKSNGDYTLTVTQLQSNTVTLSSTGTYKQVGENNNTIIFTDVGGSTFQGEFLVTIHGQSYISLINSGIPSSSGCATACYKS